MRNRIIYIFLFLIPVLAVLAQEKSTTYKAEVFGSVSTGDNTPFWMIHHNWGMVPLKSNNFYLRGDVYHNQQINKDWSFNLGFSLAGSSPHTFGTVWIQQVFGELNWKTLRLNIGSKEDYTSFLDEYLSVGDFDMSNHARPLPEIKVSIPDFILVPYTKGNFYLKGDFAVGKYLDGDWQEETARPYNQHYTKGVLSHHKSIYFRFGNIDSGNKLQFIVGMDHQAQWGGTLYQYNTVNQEYDVHRQPKGLDDFLRMMIAKEGSNSSSQADKLYVSGSQIGSYLLKLDYKLKNSDRISIYRQHFFDDGSGMALENYPDMLLGLQYKSDRKQLVSNVLFEYVYTKDQTGAIHFNEMMDEEHIHNKNKGNGNDNYYNNADYIQGPSHYGRTRGIALFLSPEYNKDGRLNFKSTRIIAFHLGLEGYFHHDLKYRFLATTGQSWGRYYVPFLKVRSGFASNLDLLYSYPKVKGLDFKLSLGFNAGRFFDDDTFGAGITITKRGIIK